MWGTHVTVSSRFCAYCRQRIAKMMTMRKRMIATREPTRLEVLESSAFGATQGLVAGAAVVPARAGGDADTLHAAGEFGSLRTSAGSPGSGLF